MWFLSAYIFSLEATSSKIILIPYCLYWLPFVLTNIRYTSANIDNIVIKYYTQHWFVFTFYHIVPILENMFRYSIGNIYNVKSMSHWKYLQYKAKIISKMSNKKPLFNKCWYFIGSFSDECTFGAILGRNITNGSTKVFWSCRFSNHYLFIHVM